MQTTTFFSAWLKTSYGDIFSSSGNETPFSQTIPSNTDLGGGIQNNDNTRTLYAPYNEQIFTVGTSMLLTNSTAGSGLLGGY